jgi:hypothetical protein
MMKENKQLDGSGGALPPLPTTAKRLLSAPIIRLASSGQAK